ncbi:MAG: DUF6572 domain-containing protein [Verrucomicrobiota bacterium]|jgi:hypothetical protein
MSQSNCTSNSELSPPENTSQPPTHAPKGVEHAGVIDFLGFDSAAGEVLLVMVEKRKWMDPELQLFQLQEKLNAYLSFALDGEMEDVYPDFVGKPLRVRLECVTPPGEQELAFLQHVHDQMALQAIAFEVEVTGESCGCGQPLSDCTR